MTGLDFKRTSLTRIFHEIFSTIDKIYMHSGAYAKNDWRAKVTNFTPIGNTQKLKRFHLPGAP